MTVIDERARASELLGAQQKAERLFALIDETNMVRAGVTEKQLTNDIYALAAEKFGVAKHWHKRIARSGPNTLNIYKDPLSDREISKDDIVFLDLGPIFEEWEADFGRTFVLGSDPTKLKLRNDLELCFADGKRYFTEHSQVTGAELYEYVADLAREHGWEYGGPTAGHMIGEFPHEGLRPGEEELWIGPQNTKQMRGVDESGRQLHWILEIHLIDRGLQIGGFYEELLTL